MRPLTVLAAGLIAALWSGLAPPAAAAEDAAVAARDAPVVIGSAGVFAVLDDFGDPLLLGLQYRGRPYTRLDLRPGVGLLYGQDGQSYLFADLAHDWPLPHRWVATLSFGFGWFNNGDDIEVVDAREFQTVLALSRRLANGGRVGISTSHISNGGLSSPNRGTETLALYYALPVGRGR
jgi:hypothetical protein